MDKTLKDYSDLITAHNRNISRLQEQVADLNKTLSEIEAADASKDEAVEEIVFEKTNGGEQEFALQRSPMVDVKIVVNGKEVIPASVNIETGLISLSKPLSAGVQVVARYTALGKGSALKRMLVSRPILPLDMFIQMRAFWTAVRDQQVGWLSMVGKL